MTKFVIGCESFQIDQNLSVSIRISGNRMGFRKPFSIRAGRECGSGGFSFNLYWHRDANTCFGNFWKFSGKIYFRDFESLCWIFLFMKYCFHICEIDICQDGINCVSSRVWLSRSESGFFVRLQLIHWNVTFVQLSISRQCSCVHFLIFEASKKY